MLRRTSATPGGLRHCTAVSTIGTAVTALGGTQASLRARR